MASEALDPSLEEDEALPTAEKKKKKKKKKQNGAVCV